MKHYIIFPLFIAMLLMSSGCTIRYSQSLAGMIPQAQGTKVRTSATGFSLFNITFSEPTPAHEQVLALMGACSRLTKIEVDYRELSFVVLGIPRVTVTAFCER